MLRDFTDPKKRQREKNMMWVFFFFLLYYILKFWVKEQFEGRE